MWETFGIRLSDPLPRDPAHREVTGTVVLPGAGDGITVVTASRADRRCSGQIGGRAAGVLPGGAAM